MPREGCADYGKPWVGEIRIWVAEFRPLGKRRFVYRIADRIRFCDEHAGKYLVEAGKHTLVREGVDWLLKRLTVKSPKLPIKVDIRWRRE